MRQLAFSDESYKPEGCAADPLQCRWPSRRASSATMTRSATWSASRPAGRYRLNIFPTSAIGRTTRSLSAVDFAYRKDKRSMLSIPHLTPAQFRSRVRCRASV